jgi:hypothetical protein
VATKYGNVSLSPTVNTTTMNLLRLTELPGWQEADAVTRTRIINGAKKYIQEYEEVATTG